MALWPVAVMTRQSESGVWTPLARSSASRRCPGTRNRKFFFKFFLSLLVLIRLLTSHIYRVSSVAWSKDGTLASGSWDKSVKVWVMDSSNKLKLQSTLSGHSHV